jgi:para-nitrobenzyl esterase
MFFLPVVDGEMLLEMPMDAVSQGAGRDVELLIGTNAEEMRLYALFPGLGELTDEQLQPSVASRLPGTEAERAASARVVLDAYRAGETANRDLFFAIETDWHLRLPAVRLAQRQAAHQPKTYMYLFKWRSPLRDGVLGACHVLEVPFVFGNLDLPKIREFGGEGPAARRLSENVMDAWLCFARNGDPSHPGIGTWPPYEASRRATMSLGETCRVELAPMERQRTVWPDQPQSGRSGSVH